jgi:hypothetical protein
MLKLSERITLLLVGFILSGPAFAYLDPGAGSFMLQMLIASILGAAFTLKMYWLKIKFFLMRLMGRDVQRHESDFDDKP